MTQHSKGGSAKFHLVLPPTPPPPPPPHEEEKEGATFFIKIGEVEKIEKGEGLDG